MAGPLLDEQAIFPVELDEEMTGGPGFMTTIVKTGSGSEQRNIHWEEPLGHWTVAAERRTPATAAKLIAFFMARRGSARGFRLKLPALDDHTVTMTATVQIDAMHFQLVKRYVDDASYQLIKTIYKPIPGSVLIYHNGVIVASGWTVDTTSGIVTFTSAPGYIPQATFEFHVPVRLREDQMQQRFQNIYALGWGSVELDELRS